MVVAHSFNPQKLFSFHQETNFDKSSLVYTEPDAGLYGSSYSSKKHET